MAKRELLIRVNPDKRENIDNYAMEIEKLGASVKNTLRVTGIISAEADDDVVEKMKEIDGIEDIRDDAEIKLPDPDKPQ